MTSRAARRRCWCGRPVPRTSPAGEIFCAEHDGDHCVADTTPNPN